MTYVFDLGDPATNADPFPAFARLRMGDSLKYMARTETLKYVCDAVTGESVWYDHDADRDEHNPLRTPPPGGLELKAYADKIAALPIPVKGEGSAPLMPEDRKQLEALGYL